MSKEIQSWKRGRTSHGTNLKGDPAKPRQWLVFLVIERLQELFIHTSPIWFLQTLICVLTLLMT